MAAGSDPPAHRVTNTVTGDVGGSVVQVDRIEGGLHQHYHQSADRVPGRPYRYGNVPQRATAFQNRTGRHLIAGAIREGHTAVQTTEGSAVTTVVTGLGGVGKTQLAADYAHTAWAADELDLLVWITAMSRDGILSDYSRLAANLCGVEDSDPDQAAQRLLGWLASTPQRWLVVLDDVRSPSDLRGLWPPASPSGRVVVTTRRRDAALRGEGRHLIEVDVFAPTEAISYLTAVLADQPDLLDGAAGLAAELGRLPLALAQAAAFMLDRNLTCAAYRARWTDRRSRLASLLPEPDGLPDEHHATVATTWSLSVEQANQLEPAGLAGVLLEVASLLDANGIPTAVFTADPLLALLSDTLGHPVPAEQARDGLGCLRRLSLITWEPAATPRAVRVHALVQRATRSDLSESRWPVVVRAVADALVAVWPEIERDTVLGQVLRGNTDSLTAVGEEWLWRGGGHPVVFRAGKSLGEAGLATVARDYYQRLHAIAAQGLGADHPDTLTARGNLAYWRGEAGDPAGAAALSESVLADRRRVLGPDHPDTLITHHNLARWRGEAGDPAGAAAVLETVLADRRRVLGPDHPDTLATHHNLARWRGEAGDAVGAAAAFEQLLADHLRVLGPDDPDTLTARHNLARWRGEAGDPASAAALFEEVLADRLRVLGADHPHTLVTHGNLAVWRERAGDAAGAVTAFERLLADQLRVLGSDHPHTMITRSNLASWRGQAGDASGAAAAFERLLADRLRVLGPDHPDTLTARHNLARWRGEAGDPAGAVALLEDVLADRARVLGADHPHTLLTYGSLARWHGKAGNPGRAVVMLETVLADRVRVLGPDHPDTRTAREDLAHWQKRSLDRAQQLSCPSSAG